MNAKLLHHDLLVTSLSGPCYTRQLLNTTVLMTVFFFATLHNRICSPVDFDTLLGGEVGAVEFGKLPFGACEEPIR